MRKCTSSKLKTFAFQKTMLKKNEKGNHTGENIILIRTFIQNTYIKYCNLVKPDKTCIWMFIVALFIIPKHWTQSKCPSIGEWVKKCGTSIQWKNILQ